MRIDVLTIFPSMFRGPFDESIVGRALERGLVEVNVHDIRQWADDRHRTVDDAPYGGGAGMVMKPGPIFAAVESLLDGERPGSDVRVILTSPSGRPFRQSFAEDLASRRRLLIICGHYEGIDERVRSHLATDEISIGDYVLTGGEIPAMVIVDSVVRLIPGVIAGESLTHESHSGGLLEAPQYTRPADFRGWAVPSVLLSGDHAKIARWRRDQAIARTARTRPDLIAGMNLTASERAVLGNHLADEHSDEPNDQIR